MLKWWFAAALFALASPLSLAQSVMEEVAEVADYTLQLNPVVESTYAIVAATDPIEADYEQYYYGEITEDQYLARLDNYRLYVGELAASTRQAFADLPDPPVVSFGEMKVGLTDGEFESLVHSSEVFSLELIDLYAGLINADEDLLTQISLSVFDRADVMIAVSNTLVQSTIDSMQSQRHPQRNSLEFVINSNNLSVVLIELQRAIYFTDQSDGLAPAIERFENLVTNHRLILRNGKRNQASMIHELRNGMPFQNTAQKAETERVINVMNTYDIQWSMELQLGERLTDVLRKIESADGDVGQLEEIIIRSVDDLISYENRRTHMIQERVKLLQ